MFAFADTIAEETTETKQETTAEDTNAACS
jgi:hypothetical protein